MISSIKHIRLAIICLFTIAITTTCTHTKHEDESRTVFNYNEMAGISSLDPASANNTEDMLVFGR